VPNRNLQLSLLPTISEGRALVASKFGNMVSGHKEGTKEDELT
jgi:hypothetical protein